MSSMLSWTLAPALAATFPASRLFQGLVGLGMCWSLGLRGPSFRSKIKYRLRWSPLSSHLTTTQCNLV